MGWRVFREIKWLLCGESEECDGTLQEARNGVVRTVWTNKAHLMIVSPATSDGPFFYKCSLCEQQFLLPEDRTPKEAVAELWATFKEHVREEHPEDAGS